MHWCDIRWYRVLVVDTDFPQRPSGSANRTHVIADMDRVDGLDLLAYRSVGDASALIAHVCSAVAPKPIIVAGSIDRAERIGAVVRGRAAAFTVGTAALDGAFPAPSGNLTDQLRYIQETVKQMARKQSAADV
jgi:hypothetical protein